MTQSISQSGSVSLNTRGIGKPNFLVQQQQHQESVARSSSKPKNMYFKKNSAFRSRDDIQKKINNRIEDQEWVKNLSYDKEIYVIFGRYFNENMAVLSRDIVSKNAESVDRF